MAGAAMVVVRRMEADDARSVAALTGELGYPATEEDIRRRYELIKESRDSCLFVAQSGDDIVGWIHVQATYLLECDARAEVWGLVVSHSARRTGVGRQLMQAAEEWAQANGLDVMSLRSNQLRTGARAFYEQLGYAVTKTQNTFRKHLA